MELINFTYCDIEPDQVYDGLNGKKLALYYNDDLYMVKFPKDKHLTNGYASSTINEYISSHIFQVLGFNTQETLLGYYEDNIVVGCKDFEYPDKKLLSLAKIKNTLYGTMRTSSPDPENSSSFISTDLYETLDAINKQQLIDVEVMRSFFWEMFIVDTLIANFDRHNGNWGILRNNMTKAKIIAPVYDNGSSLYPKVNNQDIAYYLSNERGCFNGLMLNHTTSAITYRDKKINPQNFLLETNKKEVLVAIQKVLSKLDLEPIIDLFYNIPVISDQRKEFYSKVLDYRTKFLYKILKKNKLTIFYEQSNSQGMSL